ncbi:hypothetical protein [Falsiroseomonas sp. E2-1-a4]|uniref:hypothetical protein n=1 Tax=Falsiroseomonas sp. E2-1-a4 TaxID=3239299 RepID=UPI003F34D299
MPAEGIQAQRKLIQHKGEAEHRGAIAGPSVRSDPAAHSVAALGEILTVKQLKKGT